MGLWAVAHAWRSEVKLGESVLNFHLWVLGSEFGRPGLTANDSALNDHLLTKAQKAERTLLVTTWQVARLNGPTQEIANSTPHSRPSSTLSPERTVIDVKQGFKDLSTVTEICIWTGTSRPVRPVFHQDRIMELRLSLFDTWSGTFGSTAS